MRDMKDSGIEWIGEIPNDWPLVRFKDKYSNTKEIAKERSVEFERLALTLNGVIKRPKDDSEGLQPKEFDGYQILRENDFIFKMIDLQNISTSRVGLSPYTGLVSPAYIRFSPKEKKQYNQFVYYYLMSLYYNCVYNNLGGNGVRSALNAKDMGEFLMPFPNEAEQRRICAFLDKKKSEVDALITNVQAQIEKLKAYKQSVITEVVTKGLDSTVPMKDSGVEWAPQIPKTWSILPVGRVMYEKKERTKTGAETPLSVTQAKGIILAEDANAANPTSSYIDWRCVEPEDIVFNKYKAHSGVFFVSSLSGIVTFNYSVYRCYDGYVPKYFEYQFKTAGCISEFRMSMRGVGESISPLYTRELFRIFVLCPPREEQVKIVRYLEVKFEQIDRLIAIKQAKIEKLEQYKKSLIYEYVTGKKEVC